MTGDPDADRDGPSAVPAGRSSFGSASVVGGARQDRLDLEWGHARVRSPDQRGIAGDVRRGEAVAGDDQPDASAPGDLDVDPMRGEFHGRVRVVEPDTRILDVVRRDRGDG